MILHKYIFLTIFLSSISTISFADHQSDFIQSTQRYLWTEPSFSIKGLSDIEINLSKPIEPSIEQLPLISLPLRLNNDTRTYSIPVSFWSSSTGVHQTLNLLLDTSTSPLIVFDQSYNDTLSSWNALDWSKSFDYQIYTDHYYSTLKISSFGSDLISLNQSIIFNNTTIDSFTTKDIIWRSDVNAMSSQPSTPLLIDSSYWIDAGVDGHLGLTVLQSFSDIVSPNKPNNSPPSSPFYSLLRDLQGNDKNDDNLIFALLLEPGSERIDLGGFDVEGLGGGEESSAIDALQWSVSNTLSPSQYDDLYYLSLFDMSLCGVSLFSNYSSNWLALVDTSSACLTVPGEFMDMISTWVPAITCTPLIASSQTSDLPLASSYRCYYDAERATGQLPSLSFSLSEPASITKTNSIDTSSQQRLFIPLQNLLLPESYTELGTELCLLRSEDISSRSPTFFTLGTLALKSVYTVFDLGKSRIGMAPLPSSIPVVPGLSEPSCAAPASCSPLEVYHPSLNNCIPQDCQSYWFQTTDSVTGQCVFETGFIGFLIFTLVILSGLEVAIFQAGDRLSKSIQHVLPSL